MDRRFLAVFWMVFPCAPYASGGFGPSWFTTFDSKVCQLLARPVFELAMRQGDEALAVRYLGLGAACSQEELEMIRPVILEAGPHIMSQNSTARRK